jgi:dihydrofolate reductase
MIHGIVCCAKDWAIGKQNGLLFDIPADMKFFVEQTRGTIIVMGYSTYLSLPKRPLKNRVNVVLWDKATSIDCLEGCITFNNFNDLLHFCKTAATTHKVVICGGGTIYKLFAPYYDHVWVTKVDAVDPEATAFFPNLDDYSEFECISESTPEESNGYTIRFTEYKRK